MSSDSHPRSYMVGPYKLPAGNLILRHWYGESIDSWHSCREFVLLYFGKLELNILEDRSRSQRFKSEHQILSDFFIFA